MSVQGREFILVGTAHVSQESTDLVREVLGKEKPDCVCVELDAQRYMALSQQQRWEDLDGLSGILRSVKLLYYQLLMSTDRRSNILRSESSGAPDF